jgi:Zn-dependent protease
MGNFTSRGLLLAVEMLLALLVGMSVREYALATVASRLGDPTPRLWGRLTMNPKAWFEPFGSGLVPGLIAVLWAVQLLVVPAAYAKPAPVDPSYLRRQPRDLVLVSLAGPIATAVLAVLAGFASRLVPLASEANVALVVLSYTSSALVVFHLLPIPGLDGGRIVGVLLPANIRDTYRNADRYLPLFVLLILFLFGGLTITFLDAIAGAICNAAVGDPCRLVMSFG